MLNCLSYLATQHDIAALVRGMRLTLQMLKTPAMVAIMDHSEKSHLFDHELDKLTDAQLEYVVRERVETL